MSNPLSDPRDMDPREYARRVEADYQAERDAFAEMDKADRHTPAPEQPRTVVDKLRELIRLHDEALTHALAEDGCHKRSEGQVSVHFTNFFDPEREADPLHVKSVEVYSYVLGPGRLHSFDSVDEALDAVRGWHKAEMTHDYGMDAA